MSSLEFQVASECVHLGLLRAEPGLESNQDLMKREHAAWLNCMFKKVDCILFRVPDLENALSFYRDRLHHRLAWRRRDSAAGLRMDDSDTEIVLMAEKGVRMEVDLLVDSVDKAVRDFENAGGQIVQEPFNIQIGRCAVVKDPWGNVLVILDTSKGLLKVDAEGNVLESR